MDAATDIMRSASLGPISKWVDNTVFVRIPHKHLVTYNEQCARWRKRVKDHGGQHHSGERIWYGGTELPVGRIEEFDEDLTFPVQDLSAQSPHSLRDAKFLCCLDDIFRARW